MKYFGAFEAKTHFSELLALVMKGEKFVITKHGVEVAIIAPFSKQQNESNVANSIQAIRKLRKGIKLGSDLSIQNMRQEGRP